MASSSVSQDDIDTDFEKNSRRSRIRTARARQINPSSSCRLDNNLVDINSMSSTATIMTDLGCGPSILDHGSGGGTGDYYHLHHHHHPLDSGNLDHETSPKPVIRSAKDNSATGAAGGPGCGSSSKSQRTSKMMMNHHVNSKGKQQRERRKLREKRRSTGVVNLASTESTGGSATGDDEESSDAICVETKRNTQQNESVESAAAAAMTMSSASPATTTSEPVTVTAAISSSSPSSSSSAAATPALDHQQQLQSSSSHHIRHKHGGGGGGLFPPNSASRGLAARCRDKSASDLEADDENDTHDSLNQSGISSGCCSSVPVMSGLMASCETPVLRPATPTYEDPLVERVVEENRRLLSMMDEKDRRILHLEFKIQQLMKDTLTISEEQSRLQKENKTLLRALSNLTSKEK